MRLNMENKIRLRLPKALCDLPPKCYLVGGCVRDLILGKTPDDYDVAVDGDVLAVARAFADGGNYKLVDLSGAPGFKLWRVAGRNFQADFVPLNGDDLALDLGRRDFTINAMAYEPAAGMFSDPHGGVADLAARQIVMVDPAAFINDPLRLLRAFRFAAGYGFAISDAAMAEIRKNAHLAGQPAAERILAELTKLLCAPQAALQLRQMAETGVLFALFPEMEPMREHRANNFTDISALEHTLRVVECMEALLLNPADALKPAALAPDTPKMRFVLKLAALLHDVGKPEALSVGDDGRVHYYNHENHGAATAVKVCKRLRCAKRDIWLVSNYIGAHMKCLTMFNNHRGAKRPKHKRALFYLEHDQLLPGLLYLFWADALSKKDTLKEGYLDFIADLANVYATEYLPRRQRPLPINGHDLKRVFNPRPAMFNFIMRELNVENIVRETLTEAQALQVARAVYYMLKSREKVSGKGKDHKA